MSDQCSPFEQGHSMKRTTLINNESGALLTQITNLNAELLNNSTNMTTLSKQNVCSANELRNESDNTMQWQTVTNKRPQSGSPTIDQKRTKTNNNTNLADSYNSIPTTQLNNNNISSNSNSTNMFAGLQDESDSNNIMGQNIEENTPKPPPIIVPNIRDISGMIKYFETFETII
ncbi:AAC-rich mRNA clone AAC11 protein-like [Bactrocera neohumeralis]|uniref:AAC-rich mRNA clone AAC11 protein-like n=1 Tax=Bactrocera neohumeralis TaxID=98809 RepID=UPI0021669284|nr:AAC-rich mRNA clone AAC11 protein-like [Bactrocera neohumeralis]